MKLFVSVGFESFPFDRLIRAIEKGIERKLIEGEVFIQHGDSRVPRAGCQASRFMGFDEVLTHMREADIVVGHAGVGTAFLCLEMGKVPVLFPRRACYREHVDDHQVLFARKMASRGKALVAENEDDLLFKISHYAALVDGLSKARHEAGTPDLSDFLEKRLATHGAKGGSLE
jgi:UDP-N-acetylglucosamine transferase subunit ALG13